MAPAQEDRSPPQEDESQGTAPDEGGYQSTSP
jgi:hypothetical protein